MTEQRPVQNAPARRRVFLVDDHPITLQGLAMMLNSEPDTTVCGQAATAERALQDIAGAKPNLVIVDIGLPGRNGIELIKDIAALHPQILTLVISAMDESIYAERALRAGAKGFIMKEAPVKLLLQAVHQVMSGGIYLSDSVRSSLFQKSLASSGSAPATALGVDQLTDRELEVFRLIGEGLGTRQIAENLRLSISTVETHRTHIKEKLGLQRAPELLRQAVIWLHHQEPKS